MKKSRVTGYLYLLALIVVLISNWPITLFRFPLDVLLFSIGTTFGILFLFIGAIGAFLELKIKERYSGLEGEPLGQFLGIIYCSLTILVMIILPSVLREISEVNDGATNLIILVGFLWGLSVIIVLIGVLIYREE
ncbi:MAG: hypothetical protein ACFE8G_04715 [Candidatus Hermodarchaeota archaeon]